MLTKIDWKGVLFLFIFQVLLLFVVGVFLFQDGNISKSVTDIKFLCKVFSVALVTTIPYLFSQIRSIKQKEAKNR